LYGDPSVGGTAHVPPGWTNWQGLVGNSRYYDYTLSSNGVAEKHGSSYAADYFPDVILNKTLAFLDVHLGTAPVFAVLSTPSCHGPQTAAPQHQNDFPGARSPRSPTFNATVPGTHWLQAVKGVYPFDDNAASFSDLVFRRRVQTLQTVDEMLAAVIDALTAKGQLDNTYFVYTADNGYHAGAFGIVYDKRNPWETDTHLPLLIRGPGIAPGTATAAPVSMTDLSATFLDMAGVTVPPYFDGVSVLPFARPAPPAPHIATYIEYVGEGGGGGPRPLCLRTAGDNTVMCNNAGNYSEPPYFFGQDFCLCQDALNNTYTCIRVVAGVDAAAERATMLDADGAKAPALRGATDYRYCEFSGADKTVEFFDYTTDPYELVNKAETMDAALKAALHARLAALGQCQGNAQCEPLLVNPIA
jgi:N-acetylglucosamine-6-sulfatase